MNHEHAIREAVRSRRTLVFHACTPALTEVPNPFVQYPDCYQLVAAVDTDDFEEACNIIDVVRLIEQRKAQVQPVMTAAETTGGGDV